MLRTDRLLYVGFMCHLVIEKLLKALYVKLNETIPPFTHNLLYLTEKTNIVDQFEENQKDFLDSLQSFNIRARYPADKDELFKLINLEKSKKIITNTKKFVKWIKNRL